MNTDISEDENTFIERFVQYMVGIVGETFTDGGDSVEAYARSVAPSYWADEFTREWGPEDCVAGDMEGWDC